MYLIQGFFLKKDSRLEVRTGAEGSVTMIREGLLPFMYSGVVLPDEKNPTLYTGRMIDCFGESTIFDGIISPNNFLFYKIYDSHKEGVIRYRFEKKGEIWIGHYSNSKQEGRTKCVLRKAPEEFSDFLSAL